MSKAATPSNTALATTRTPARRYCLKVLNGHVNRVIPKGASAVIEEVRHLRESDFPDLHRKLLHCEIEHKSGATETFLLRANLKPDGKFHLTFESKLAHYRGAFETYPSPEPNVEVRIIGHVVGRYTPVEIFDGASKGGLVNV